MTQIVDNSAMRAALLYLAVLIVLFTGLTFAVIFQRRSKKVGIGDGGDRHLARWIRVHGNYVENATFGIPVIFGLVFAGAGATSVHLIALTFIFGRLAHAQGLASSAGSSPGRAIGMVVTHLSLLVAAGIIVSKVLAGQP